MAVGDNGFARRDRPIWVRGANAIGRAGGAIGCVPLALDPALLEARARARSGLADFGTEDYREPLDVLCDAVRSEANLTLVGRRLAHDEITNHLENRLQITDTLKRIPEISQQEVAPPIFITGSGRSGTSILHEVMARDPALRALLHWEALFPAPSLDAGRHANEQRVERGHRDVVRWERIAPRYKTMHDGDGTSPQECDFLFAATLRSDHIANAYNVPSYSRWLASADFRPAFEMHRRCLQVLQWRAPTQRWVLKAPSHIARLDALFSAYPDSPVIVTHRDPLKVLASMTSLVSTLLWLRSDRVDPPRVAGRLARGIGSMLLHTMGQRQAGRFAGRKIIDVRYLDFVADPSGTVKRVYAQLGLEFSQEVALRISDYVARKPRDRGHGIHRYTFEDTGLDLEEQRERYRPYMEYYGVMEEEL